MDATFNLQGFNELTAKLREMPDNINRNALRAAVSSGAALVRDETKLRAPVKSGVLRRSLYIKQVRELSELTRQTFFIGARQGRKEQAVGKKRLNRDAYYGKWVERGHRIVARFKGKYTDYKIRGRGRLTGLAVRRAAPIGYVPPQPFLYPAFLAKREAAIDSMAAKLRERIERYRTTGK